MQQCTGLHSCKVRKLFTKSSQSYTAPYVFFMHRLSANFFIMESVGSTYSNSTNTQWTNMKNEIIYLRQNQRLGTSCHSFGFRNKLEKNHLFSNFFKNLCLCFALYLIFQTGVQYTSLCKYYYRKPIRKKSVGRNQISLFSLPIWQLIYSNFLLVSYFIHFFYECSIQHLIALYFSKINIFCKEILFF